MDLEKTRTGKAILSNKGKAGNITIPDSKLYYKAAMVERNSVLWAQKK